jgi:hypothetical protein
VRATSRERRARARDSERPGDGLCILYILRILYIYLYPYFYICPRPYFIFARERRARARDSERLSAGNETTRRRRRGSTRRRRRGSTRRRRRGSTRRRIWRIEPTERLRRDDSDIWSADSDRPIRPARRPHVQVHLGVALSAGKETTQRDDSDVKRWLGCEEMARM